jgi:two-component system nitrogen regulation response regulator GlnG
VGCQQHDKKVTVVEEHTPHQTLRKQPDIHTLMGHSLAIRQIHQKIIQVAPTNFTVIVQGDTGTGKELVARLIHEYSDRAHKPFLAIDCGAIPDTLVESELFGHMKGAFTGAESRRTGYFKLAEGGTLFLDEIANLPLSVQMKLLRTVQERRISPLGSERNIPTDVRIIVASNVVLEEEVQAGHFRADLFHRLNEFKIYLPPLRDRREDVLFLAERFRHETNTELGKNVPGFTRKAQDYLTTYDWPGNVRELRNTVRRAVLLSNGLIDLPQLRPVATAPPTKPAARADQPARTPQKGCTLQEVIDAATGQLEKALIQHVLQETKGNKRQAAKTLQIGYKTLYRKLEEYGLD